MIEDITRRLPLICGSCGGPVESTENEKGGTWRGPCGRSHGAWLNEGALDLGIVRGDEGTD